MIHNIIFQISSIRDKNNANLKNSHLKIVRAKVEQTLGYFKIFRS